MQGTRCPPPSHLHVRIRLHHPKHESSGPGLVDRDLPTANYQNLQVPFEQHGIQHLHSERGTSPTRAHPLDSVCVPGITWTVHPVKSACWSGFLKMSGHRAPSWLSVAPLPKACRSSLERLPEVGCPVVARPTFCGTACQRCPVIIVYPIRRRRYLELPVQDLVVPQASVCWPMKSHLARQSTIVRAMLPFEGPPCLYFL